jgi:hypothetical protein
MDVYHIPPPLFIRETGINTAVHSKTVSFLQSPTATDLAVPAIHWTSQCQNLTID